MSTLREIKKRVVNISGIQRITQSLKAVATARLGVVKAIKTSNEAFFTTNETAFARLFWLYKNKGEDSKPLYQFIFNNKTVINNPLIIYFTSNRGLCGAYNSNIARALQNEINKESDNYSLLAFGAKGYGFAKKRYGNNLLPLKYSSELNDTSPDDFMLAALKIVNLIKHNKINAIKVVYTFSNSVISQEIKVERLMPLNNEVDNLTLNYIEDNVVTDEKNFNENLEQLLVRYLAYKLYKYFINSLIAEFSSRLTAMDNAYENSKELKEELNLIYNRTRQTMVTKEISEIVAGAEAS